jgi:hypothetical protein
MTGKEIKRLIEGASMWFTESATARNTPGDIKLGANSGVVLGPARFFGSLV